MGGLCALFGNGEKMRLFERFLALALAVVLLVSVLCSCVQNGVDSGDIPKEKPVIGSLEISGESKIELELGETRVLLVDVPEAAREYLEWSVIGDAVTVDQRGVVIAVKAGGATVKVSYGALSDTVTVRVSAPHEHNFVDGRCECGVIDPDYTEPSVCEHSFSDGVCTKCGAADPTYTPSHKHTFVDGKCECGAADPDYTPENPPHEHRFVDGKCECGEVDPSYKPPFGAEYPAITVAEALELAKKYTSSASTEKFYIIGTVRTIESASNGRMYIYDESGEIYVYKCTYFDGSSISDAGIKVGDSVVIYGTLRNYSGTLEVESGTVVLWDGESIGGGATDGEDPYEGVSAEEFYKNYKRAESYLDSKYRTKHNFMSGSLEVPDAAPEIAENRPKSGTKFIKNSTTVFLDDGNTYVVYDALGVEAFRVYRGGAYITLEEVAAHMYAFGVIPANHSSSKNTSPSSSPWGEYLRVNHTKFSGDTSRYKYEPELPEISGCGGSKIYYEMDIGTTGTDTGGGYQVRIYNNGSSIVRGAARIVYTWNDGNKNGRIDAYLGEVYVFYTYNHYNDFQEYLNYFGGWGEMFGNVTGGGTLSSNTNYNPTPYVPVAFGEIGGEAVSEVALIFVPLWESKRQI